jgi:bleomycin hydrolase
MHHLSWENKNYQSINNIVKHDICSPNNPSNQHHTGYCWLYAGLNCIRVPFIKENSLLPSFHFSPGYLMFWDKFEKSKYFLNNYHSFSDNVENHFISKPVQDAGQWNMFVNLVEKYGIIPQSCFPDSYTIRNTDSLNLIINHKLRHSVLHSIDPSETLDEIYKILEDFYGEMPKRFTWMYNVTSDTLTHSIKNITPRDFFICFVNCDLNSYISLINDPRNPYNTFYESKYLTNMDKTSGLINYNISQDEFIDYTQESLLQNIPVWSTCDIHKYVFRDHGICNANVEDQSLLLMNKKERLKTFDSYPNHAVVLHGFTKDQNWKFENSWGFSHNGFYYADHKWFSEYCFQVVVPKRIAKSIPKIAKSRKIPIRDPFGLSRIKIAL